jgi:DNA repair exonuclease SbcCD nuclease subunit
VSRNYVLIGDVHATRRPPSSCTETYLEDLFDLLNQVARVCSRRQAEALVIAGDLFHHKAPSRTDHGLVAALIRLFQSVCCPVFVVPGNHDCQNDRLDSIEASQPLGVLFESGAATRLEEWEGSYSHPPHPLYGVPWQQHWSEETVRDALAGYREVARSWQELPAAERGTVPVRHLVVTHAPIYPPGHELKWENTPSWWWANAMGNRGSVFYGHVHEPHGVYHSNGVTFCNNGALSRGSLHEYNLDRQVGCTVWDSSRIGPEAFQFVPLQARPASEVFRLREAEKAVDSQLKLSGFLASIGSARLDVMSVESVAEHIARLDIDPAVKARARELLDEAAP